MIELLIASAGCLMLGVVTTLHPCPLTSNIAAVTLIAGWTSGKNSKLALNIYFTTGYIISLLTLSILLNYSFLSLPKLSIFLQSILSAFLGPLLIIVGMILSGLIRLNQVLANYLPSGKNWRNKSGIYALPLGLIMALAFCPATASIYFGVLIPLSVKFDQAILFPILFAGGAALPVIIVSILIHRGVIKLMKDPWIQKIPVIAGALLIVIGIYTTINQLYLP